MQIRMRVQGIVTLVGVLGVLLNSSNGYAQQSAALAEELVQLLNGAQLDAIAAKDSEGTDRFVAALDLRNQRAERVAYIVRAVTPGEYTLPGVVVQDMYAADTFARSETGRVVIAPRG